MCFFAVYIGAEVRHIAGSFEAYDLRLIDHRIPSPIHYTLSYSGSADGV